MFKNYFYVLFCILIFNFGFSQVGTYQIAATSPVPSTFTTLQDAINTIGNSTSTLHINNSLTVNSNLVVPKNLSLKFYNGSIITISNGVTLTINGPMDAGNFQIFNCIGSGKVNGRPKIEHALPQWWQPISQSDWTKSIQNAVNFHSKVHLSKIYWPDDLTYEGIYYINNSIDLAMDSNHIIYGDGPSSLIVSSSNNPVFRMINNTGSPTGKEYASFENLMFQCMNGIQINQDDNSDPVETKQILNVKIKNCHFYNNGSTGNTAINLYETFDSVISENYIEGFEIGIKLAACDLNTISNNRIMKFSKYAILDLSRINSNGNLQFGSQNLIFHNDILIYNGPSNSGAFIKSNSLHIIIRDNFLENTLTNIPLAFIDCSNVNLNNLNIPLIVDVTGNRLSKGALYSYLLNEDFRSLNLSEGPMAIPINEIPISSFCTNTNSLNLKRTIPINYSGRPKAIKISNVFSFREWSSFETSNILQNSFNGSLILNPENISNLGWSPSGKASFNPKNIELKNGTPNYTVIQISQKISSETGELNGLPKRLKIKLLTRNFPTSTTNNDDFYIKILKSNDATNTVWEGRGTYLTSNTSNATYNNFNTYSITPTIDFDSNSDYWLLIDSSAPTLANSQIKSIVIEPGINNFSSVNSTTVAAEKDDKQNETEELQRIIVDNTIKFYPNPVKENLTIEVKNGDLLKKVEVFDEVGKYIGDFTDKLNNNTIDITSLPSGNYIIKTISITNTSEVIIKK